MEKYRELYNLALKVYDEQHERYVNLNDKGSKYLAALTLIIGIYGYYSKWIIDNVIPPKNSIQIVIIIVAMILFILLIITWFITLAVMSIGDLVVLPLTQETIDFFDDSKHRLIDIYFAMSRGIKDAVDINIPVIDRRANFLVYSYRLIRIDSILFFLLTILYLYYKWSY